ncbi:hypothetical protein ABFW14_28080 [Mycolicibacterium fortuitum]|uniref:hypothetical protein n=1 Tax=Mycolicibacterium fortuitum TaxID=1766 RepID=UPI0034CD0FA1
MTDHTPQYGSPANRDKDGNVTSYGRYPQCLIRNAWDAPPAICQALQQENQARISI